MLKKLITSLTILNYLGSLLFIFGFAMMLPALVHLIFPGPGISVRIIAAFVIPGTLISLLGLILTRRLPDRVPNIQDGMMITALAWITVSLAGTIPLFLILDQPFIDTFFEATSGITASGLTIFTGLDEMPPALLFWRSFMQWIGGIGILTFFLAVSFRGGSTAATLFSAEGHKIHSSRPVPGIFNTVKIIWMIYAALTLLAFFLLYAEGMSLFDAINHTLTLVSTGGFSTHDASIAYFSHFKSAPLIEYTMIFFMLMGGTNFLLHYKVSTGDWQALYKDFEMRLFWLIIGGAFLLIGLDVYRAHGSELLSSWTTFHLHFRSTLFQTVSIITSTGYATRNLNDPYYPALAKQVFLLLMFVGGCIGSTAGGFKVLRLGVLGQTLASEIKQLSLPGKAVIPLVIQQRIIPGREVRRICALLFAWIGLIWTGTSLTLAFTSLDVSEALSGMLSAVSNMGPFFFSTAKLASFPACVKITYIFGMLAGRLEVLPMFVLCARLVGRQGNL
ncbi:MAG: TrkH family potassium uptake protein [Deltaproteobacteria bacterium]|nr:TrkH family potassium uptake protein [Deltaproteobacteria bacterium]